MKIETYKDRHKEEWDNFVRSSKNGTFLFCRNFIEYHKDRFTDSSFLFYNKDNKLIALLPGHIKETIYYSHMGLTYGGLVMGISIRTTEVLEIFDSLLSLLKRMNISRLIYKPIPHIYHQMPSEEDLYALFRHKGVLSERKISSALLVSNRPKYSNLRIRGIKKATTNNFKVATSDDLDSFWQILSNNLKQKYKVAPVHSIDEIKELKSQFNNEIKLYAVKDAQGEVNAGCVVFETANVAHVQYIAATEIGKEGGAIDLLTDWIINNTLKTYFDYGTSTENGGVYLNKDLIHQKEGFGARAIIYDTYTIDLK